MRVQILWELQSAERKAEERKALMESERKSRWTKSVGIKLWNEADSVEKFHSFSVLFPVKF